jgi:hypothetical protein
VSLLGLLLDQQWGLLIAAPVYVLAAVGLIALWRAGTARPLLRWMLFCIIPYILLVAAYKQWWGEWCPPARYLMTITPLMALPLGHSLLALRHSRLYLGLFTVLAALGWAEMAGLIAHPRSFWNHPSGQSDLFLWFNTQYHVNLVPRLPAIVLWSIDHRKYAMRWDLLGAWSAIVIVVVLAALMLLPDRGGNRRQPAGP